MTLPTGNQARAVEDHHGADIDGAIAFYQQAFGFHYDVTRRTDEGDYSSFMFSKYGGSNFFLIHLLDESAIDQPSPTTFRLFRRRSRCDPREGLAAGPARGHHAAGRAGMPRNSAVKDPNGNWIWIYQG